ncbi:MAG: hypothetical protein LBH04_07785 [Tannerellaceae bacterium]|jgi:hypothetical protein|nr:hypothetical protein [Tannerellaceae bacterium]
MNFAGKTPAAIVHQDEMSGDSFRHHSAPASPNAATFLSRSSDSTLRHSQNISPHEEKT